MFGMAVRMMTVPDIGVLPETLEIGILVRRAVLVLPLPSVVNVHIHKRRSADIVVRFGHGKRLE